MIFKVVVPLPEVKLVDVTKKYESIVAVEGVNLHVADGEYFTIVGPTGAGKTTTLMMIAGLVKPDYGGIYIDGKIVNDLLPEERNIGFMFQGFELFPHLSVWDNVTYGPFVKSWNPEVYGKSAREMLEIVHLAGRFDAFPHELSGGMQQRIALVRALTSGARLLLLDEPLGSLDAKTRFELRYELRRLVKDLGLTAIHVTHDMEEAMTVSDRIAILRKGKFLQVGNPHEVYSSPINLFVANFMSDTNLLEGIVKSKGEKWINVELKNGGNVRVTDGRRDVGEDVVLAVRSEDVIIRKGGVSKTNALSGYIESSKFISGYIRYEVRLDNGDRIVLRKVASRNHFFKVNERVTASFNPEKTLVYPYPEEGMEKAISPD